MLTVEHQDTTLWIHIAIQITSFGVIFPTGMVLGVRRPLLWPCPHLCKSDCFSDHSFTMARTSPSLRRPSFSRRLLPWPCPWWSPIRPQRTLFLRTLPNAHAHPASRTWRLPKAASGERHTCEDTSIHGHGTRCSRESIAGSQLGADALRRHYSIGILSRGSSGPMPSALHHGQRLHRLRHHPHNPAVGRSTLAQEYWSKPRIL